MNAKGFTLVELLVVIVVIGILAAISMPRLTEARERSHVAAMQSDMGQLRTAMEMCHQDGGHTYVGCDEALITGTTGVSLAVAGQTGTTYTIAATHASTASWVCDYDHEGGATPGQIICQ